MKNLFLLLGLLCSFIADAQTSTQSKPSATSVGLEADILPYLTGGYYGSVWIAHNHFRYRTVITKVTTPEFITEDGFTNNKLMVYTLLADYFFKPRVEKWWVGAGFEYWDAEIQTDARISTVKYKNIVATLGGGYVWKFYKNFYFNPWGALHARIGGDKNVMVDGAVFKPALFTPEGSLKIGWYFNTKKR